MGTLYDYETIITLRGAKPGKTSVVLAGVHGNEVSGIMAFNSIIPQLSIMNGAVTFIFGNPKAIASRTRFVEQNLNRLFKPKSQLSAEEVSSYEYGRAELIKEHLNSADTLLDIHNSFTPKSEPFVICENNASAIAKILPVNKMVSGFDEVEPGGTDYYMNTLGKQGLCLECGYFDDETSHKIAEEGLLNFLGAQGHIDRDVGENSSLAVFRMHQLYKTKTDAFVLRKPFADFEFIAANQPIGQDGDEIISPDQDSIILFARDRNKTGEEAFLLGRQTQ